MRRFSTFVIGAVCGALVGSVTALLLAPASGNELRDRAQQVITSFGEDIREAYKDQMGQLEKELAVMRNENPDPAD